MNAKDKTSKKDSAIISEMRGIIKNEDVFDKWYDKLMNEIEESSVEYENLLKEYKRVTKESKGILKKTEELLKEDNDK